MSHEELLGWFEYFKLQPVGWREDYRAALQIRAQGVNAKPSEIFPSLKIIERKPSVGNSLKGSALFVNLLSAKGGDDILRNLNENPDISE